MNLTPRTNAANPPCTLEVFGLGSTGIVRGGAFEIIHNFAMIERIAREESGRRDVIFYGAGLDVDRYTQNRSSLYANRKALSSQLERRLHALEQVTRLPPAYCSTLAGPIQFDPTMVWHDAFTAESTRQAVLVDLEGDRREEIASLFDNKPPGEEQVEFKEGTYFFYKTPAIVSYEFLAGEQLPKRARHIAADTGAIARHMLEHRRRVLEKVLWYANNDLGVIHTPPEGIDLATLRP